VSRTSAFSGSRLFTNSLQRSRIVKLACPLVSLVWALGCSSVGPCDETEELCLVTTESTEAFLSVRAPADDDVWLVGSEAEPEVSGPAALHWNGASWDRLDLSAFAGHEIWWGHPAAEVTTLVGSGGLILEYDRSSGVTTRVEGPAEEVTFFGVWGSSADDVWSVGGDIGGSLPGQIWRRTDAGWAPVELPESVPESTVWFKVDGRSAEDVWFVGSQGQALHWDGTELLSVSAAGVAQGSSLFTVDAQGDEVLAVGGTAQGYILHRSSDEWVDRTPEFASGINGVCRRGDVTRAVGPQGTVYTYQDESWSYDLEGLTLRDYHACDISPSGDVWAVGGQVVSRPLNAGVVAYAGMSSIPSPPSY